MIITLRADLTPAGWQKAYQCLGITKINSPRDLNRLIFCSEQMANRLNSYSLLEPGSYVLRTPQNHFPLSLN